MSVSVDTPNDSLTDGLMGDFLDESTDNLRRLNEGLLELDQSIKCGERAATNDEELLNGIFRAAHSLKGLSGMMGMQGINALTHKLENVFDAVRTGRMAASGEIVDVSFQAVDRLDAMIELLRNGGDGEIECHAVLERIEQVLQIESTEARKHESPPTVLAETPTVESTVSPASDDPLADIQDDGDIPAKYLGMFIDESEQTLDTLSDVLLQDVDVAAVESLLVCCHRIKGSAASIGLRRLARLAHLMEDQLQELRRNEATPTTDAIDAFLLSVDSIRAYVNGLRTGSVIDDGLGDACRQMILVGAPHQIKNDAARRDDPTERAAQLQKLLRAAANGTPPEAVGFTGVVEFEPGLPLVELKAQLVLEKLYRVGTVFHSHPQEHELETIGELRHVVFGIVTDARRDALHTELAVSGVVAVELFPFHTGAATNLPQPVVVDECKSEPVADEPTGVEGETPQNPGGRTTAVSPAATAAKNKPTETIRVDIERLDQLMNLAGQLVITKARFTQIGQKLKGLFSDKLLAGSLSEAMKQTDRLSSELRDWKGDRALERDSLYAKTKQIQDDLGIAQRDLGRLNQVRGLLSELAEAVHQFGRVSDGIQSSIMDTRMVPIGPLFTRFKRVVRDLSRTSGKEIDLVIHGEHTELDKRMIDELGDPLIHMIRNSADHGIEKPSDREAAGKPRQGTITLNAFHRGSRIVIQVSDDGRGLDAAKIRAKAVSKGWMSEADAEKMPDSQVYQLIWRPGFSTAEKVTEVSGRGMGMDIVWSKIEQLNGSVELSSTLGQGTTFELKLPLTMAILPSLLMVIDAEVFAVPVESVIEIVRIAESDVTTVYGRPMARVRGRVISLVRLKEVFGVDAAPDASTERSAGLTIVIVGIEGRELGILVDDLLGEQEVVIKSLTENFQNIDGIAGASILGDGRVSLILDVAALLEMACRTPRDVPLAAAPVE